MARTLTEEQRKHHIQKTMEYNAKAMKQIKFNLNRTADADIIEFLEGQDNVQGLIKALIREYMKK